MAKQTATSYKTSSNIPTPWQGGAAEHIARQLDVRLREHLGARQNLFSEAAPALAASLARPLLCLFDRNFELSVVRSRCMRPGGAHSGILS